MVQQVSNDKKQSNLKCRRNARSWLKTAPAASVAQLRRQKLQLQCSSTHVDVATAFPVVTFPVRLVGRSASCNEREVRKEFTFQEFKVCSRCSSRNRGFGEAQSPLLRSQDAELVEGSGVGWQSVSISLLCHVHFVRFCVFRVYLFEKDTYPKLWRHATPTS